MEVIRKRISALRDAMFHAGVSAYIVPGTDPHASEYISPCWKEREWISGFTGSAGTVVIGRSRSGLWTDSRYFLQAADQLSDTGIELMKSGLPETPDMVSWLKSLLKPGDSVGVNPLMFSVNGYKAMQAEFASVGIALINLDLIHSIWLDKPAIPLAPAFPLPVKYSGKSVSAKLADVRKGMIQNKTDMLVLSMLDEIAWLFNIRGTDVPYNPVTICYATVGLAEATLFIESEKVDNGLRTALRDEGVVVAPYSMIYDTLKSSAAGQKFMFDGSKLNKALYDAFPEGCEHLNILSPVARLKSIKNQTEIEGFRRAMVKDGVALTRFFKWLEENVHSGTHTELSVDEKLTQFRAQQPESYGPSFNSISSYMSHGAIVHYSATPETDAALLPEGIYLLDSGGQYLDGTTDITRTISLGNPTAQQRNDFSLVLKGNIALNKVIFPVNTRGSQLDVLARMAMWQKGINYGHGTGHGVGHYLNVHEGPQSIRAEENPVVIEEGMVMSNEPGIYRTGEYGMRTENMMCVVPAFRTEFGTFLTFETLTLCYIDRQLMDFDVLDNADVEWIDKYHQKVYDSLSPYLDQAEKLWLQQKCAPCK